MENEAFIEKFIKPNSKSPKILVTDIYQKFLLKNDC